MKVDCQAGIGLMGSKRGGGPAVAAAFHGALEDSIRTHFPGNHAINCMAHSTENIYRCAAPQRLSMAPGGLDLGVTVCPMLCTSDCQCFDAAPGWIYSHFLAVDTDAMA